MLRILSAGLMAFVALAAGCAEKPKPIAMAEGEITLEKTTKCHTEIYDRLAEIAGEYLKKGKQVYVEGSLQTREWTDREGNKRSTTEIRAQRVQMLGRADDRHRLPRRDVATAEDVHGAARCRRDAVRARRSTTISDASCKPCATPAPTTTR